MVYLFDLIHLYVKHFHYSVNIIWKLTMYVLVRRHKTSSDKIVELSVPSIQLYPTHNLIHLICETSNDNHALEVYILTKLHSRSQVTT